MRKKPLFLFAILSALFQLLSFTSCYEKTTLPPPEDTDGAGDTLVDEINVTEIEIPADMIETEDIIVETGPEEALPPPLASSVDILAVVDNSGSMAEEQEILRNAMPILIRNLLNPPIDPETGQRVHEPVRDIHIGVISTDLGVGGYAGIATCEDDPVYGDDGILQHSPHGPYCERSYPLFLDYSIPQSQEPNPAEVDKLATDFGCIASLGTEGCGFEQQLESMYRALVEKTEHGEPNYGFLRDDALLVVLILSDEDDCSAQDLTLFDIQNLPWDVNLQCYYNKSKLFPVDRYVSALKGLKRDPDHVIFSVIVGVPPVSDCEGEGDDISNCLIHPQMQERVNSQHTMLEPSCKFPPDCTVGSGYCSTVAYPAVRFVQVAQGFGNAGIVQSICSDNYARTMELLSQKIVSFLAL